MMAPAAKPPMAGPHQRASAVVGVATVVRANVPAAARAVRVCFMGSPLCELEGVTGQTSSLSQAFHADADRGLNCSLQMPDTLVRRRSPLSLRCTCFAGRAEFRVRPQAPLARSGQGCRFTRGRSRLAQMCWAGATAQAKAKSTTPGRDENLGQTRPCGLKKR